MPEENQPLTRKERLNRNLLYAAGALGGVIGVVLVWAGELSGGPEKMLAAPLSPTVAMVLIAAWLLVLPIAYFWHKVVDEQEVAAYRDGAYYAGYTQLILTPIWWLLFRGGMAPAPDAMICLALFSLIWSVVWLWKKYV